MAAAVDFILSGGASNTDPQLSRGGAKSATPVNSSADQNLFANVGSTEAEVGSEKYRCIYIEAPVGKTFTNLGVWISTPTPSNSSRIAIGLAPEGLNGEAELIPDEVTAPADVVFTRPVADYQRLSLPDLNPGDYIALWIKRTISVQAQGFDNDYARLTVEGVEV